MQKLCKNIPLLKKIAVDLNDKIEMIYISIDETNTVKAWKKLMIDHEITCRSLLAANNMKEINELINIGGLPALYMVYPDSRFEKIEVRYEPDLKRLYEIAGNQ